MSDDPDEPAAQEPAVEDFEVPAGEEPAARCPHCGRPFRTEGFRDLHVGERHAGATDDGERQRYEAAREAEEDELFVYHLKVVAGIVAVVMGYVYLYGFVLS